VICSEIYTVGLLVALTTMDVYGWVGTLHCEIHYNISLITRRTAECGV